MNPNSVTHTAPTKQVGGDSNQPLVMGEIIGEDADLSRVEALVPRIQNSRTLVADWFSGQTFASCLHAAAQQVTHPENFTRLLRILMDAGMPIDVRNENGQTALHFANELAAPCLVRWDPLLPVYEAREVGEEVSTEKFSALDAAKNSPYETNDCLTLIQSHLAQQKARLAIEAIDAIKNSQAIKTGRTSHAGKIASRAMKT